MRNPGENGVAIAPGSKKLQSSRPGFPSHIPGLIPTSHSDGGGVGHDLSKTFFGKFLLRFIRKENRM